MMGWIFCWWLEDVCVQALLCEGGERGLIGGNVHLVAGWDGECRRCCLMCYLSL